MNLVERILDRLEEQDYADTKHAKDYQKEVRAGAEKYKSDKADTAIEVLQNIKL